MRARAPLAFMVAVALLGCSPSEVIVVNGIDVYESHWQQALDDLGPRASVDLGCPLNQLGFALFKRTGRAPTEVGVAGCGKTATYVRPTHMQFIAGGGAYMVIDDWVLDSAQAAPASAAPAQQPQAQSAAHAPAAPGLHLGD